MLVGFPKGNYESVVAPTVEKIITIRLFPNDKGCFDNNIIESDGELLVVSQFTLYGDTLKGRRPDLGEAMESERAKAMYESFVKPCQASGIKKVATGKFGAMIEVSLVNDGATTICMER